MTALLIFAWFIALPLIPKTPLTKNTYTAQAAQNLSSWVDANGASVNPGSIPRDRFVFIDPIKIKDTVTNKEYENKATENEIYSNGTTSYRDSGWFWHWPNGGNGPTLIDGKCTGALVLRVDGVTVELYAVGSTKLNGTDTCIVPDGAGGGQQTDTTGKGDDPNDENEYKININPSILRMALAAFRWKNAEFISTYDGDRDMRKLTPEEKEFIKQRQGNNFFEGKTAWTNNNCTQDNGLLNAFMIVDNNRPEIGKLFYDDNGSYHDNWDGNQLDCIFGRNVTSNPSWLAGEFSSSSNQVYIAHPETITTEPPSPPGGGGSDTSNVNLECEIRLFNPLTWIACPLIEAAEEGVQKFDNAITQRLIIKVGGVNGYMNTSGERGKAFYAAWSTFRYMALIILVIIGLVMVIAQATSVQLFDAYTVKKVMPRIFIAVIAITLSWSLMKFAIQLTNEIGIGLRSMLFAPFASLGDPRIQQGAAYLLGFGAVAGVGAGLAGLGMLGILTFALGALLAVLIGFGVIVFREMLVMLLVVTAPVAIICWIVPGTEKVWKMWSDFFLKALIAFPIITLMITLGHIFAKIVASGANPTLVETTIVFICYFGPYFMIPTAFKLAGGALATVSGMAYGKAQGASQALKGFRKKQWGKNMEKIDAAKRFNPEGKLAGLNRHLQTASIVGRGKAGINPALMRARANASRDSHIIREAEELREKSAAWRAIDADDTLTEAAQHAHGREAIERHLKASKRYGHLQGAELAQTVAAVEAAQKEAPRDVVAAASVMARAASGTGHADHADMYDDIMAATEGNQTLRNNLLAKTRSLSGQNGRPELAAPGHTFSEDNMREYSEGRITRDELNERMRTEALRVAGAHTIGNGREEFFGHQMDTLAKNYEDARNAGNIDKATELAAQIASFRNASGSLPSAQSEMINDMLARVGVQEDLIDPNTGMAYSTDDQLGMQLAGFDNNPAIDQALRARLDVGDDSRTRTAEQAANLLGLQATRAEIQARNAHRQQAQARTQAVRTRSGLYDAGGANRTPEQVRAAQMADPNQQP